MPARSGGRRHESGDRVPESLYGRTLRRAVAWRDVPGIVVADPDLARLILPDERLERQIDAYSLAAFDERRAALRVAEDQQLSGAEVPADFRCAGRVVYAGEDGHSLLGEQGLEAIHRHLRGVVALRG